MKDKILEAFKKLPDKHEYLKVYAGVDAKNPDLWVKENILESPLPVQEMFYRQLTDEYDAMMEKVRKRHEQLQFEIDCKIAKELSLRYLKETDWTQLPDAPLSQNEKMIYRRYRAWLRKRPKEIEQDAKGNRQVFKFEEWRKIYEK
jgi:hypothetical protein